MDAQGYFRIVCLPGFGHSLASLVQIVWSRSSRQLWIRWNIRKDGIFTYLLLYVYVMLGLDSIRWGYCCSLGGGLPTYLMSVLCLNRGGRGREYVVTL
ncbi:hypothetical protein F5Y00DRAFT_189201 [Daldinia vernicosa]|uniref:uncharacterized protein n=1 Tax=Daldinia vernicosa TaxID=114800 RepID=UPI00200823A7|nr:uncharacterized protein F5Y00DRAFT_189201 [Daldinia vernicosa]KAI0844703.1 hypothetical protein F5Y00DRAFT_189201 [Daldinia vernicosa]